MLNLRIEKQSKLQTTIIATLLLAITLVFSIADTQAQDFPDVCQQPENILPNCSFDSGLSGWQSFLETGAADFAVLQGGGECHAPLCPAGYIVTQDHFIGGIYQQVPVAKGNNYYANIVWLVFDSLANDQSVNDAVGGGIGRRVGIDPFGGTDSKSENVVWSEDNWRNDCKICNVEHVTVTAQADTITVFLRLDDTWRVRARERGLSVPVSKDQFWLDDLGLKQVGGEAIPAAAPTDTPPPPPTDTPEPPPATDTPVPQEDTPTPELEASADDEPEEVAEADTSAVQPVSPVETPTPVPPTNTPAPVPPTLTPTSTPPPTDTPLPRPTPQPTRTRSPRPSPTPESSDLPLILGAAGTTVCLGGGLLLVIAVVLAGLVWLYRVGWSSDEDDDYDYEEYEDDE